MSYNLMLLNAGVNLNKKQAPPPLSQKQEATKEREGEKKNPMKDRNQYLLK